MTGGEFIVNWNIWVCTVTVSFIGVQQTDFQFFFNVGLCVLVSTCIFQLTKVFTLSVPTPNYNYHLQSHRLVFCLFYFWFYMN